MGLRSIHHLHRCTSAFLLGCVCPVCECLKHARKLDSTLNECCRIITGCLKPTRTDHLHILTYIALLCIRRAVASQSEWIRQEDDHTIPCSNTPLKCHTSITEEASAPPLLPSMSLLPTHAPVYSTTPSIVQAIPH